ncbi:MAG: hypothetical protein WC508_05410 [Patescibacteria group bacterium]
MARINTLEQSTEIKNSNKKLDEPRLGKKRNRLGKKSDCCLFLLVGLVVFGVLGAVVLAKTGIAQVPVLSKFLYRVPQPIRVVDIGDINTFKPTGFKAGIAKSENLVYMYIPEKELTYLAKTKLTGKPDSFFASNLQTVIENQQVEVFGLLIKPFKANLTAKLKLYISNGNPGFKITQFKIGNLSIPSGTANFIAHRLVDLNKLKTSKSGVSWAQMKDKIKIQNFELVDNKIHIVFWVNLSLAGNPNYANLIDTTNK